MIQNFIRFGRGPAFARELKSTLHLALPLMLGELCGILMGMAGTMMAGHLGETALAASGIAGVVFVMSMLLIWGGVRMIPTPMAEAHELRDGEKVRTLLLAGLWLSGFFLLASSVLLGLGIANFDLLKQDPEVSRLAVGYLKIILFSMPALILFAVLVNITDAFGLVRITMFISIGGLAVDVFLNWLFMFGNWGMPRMGINAIAINTGITHVLMTTAIASVLWKKKDLAYFRKVRTNMIAVRKQTIEFIRYGIPSALQIMVEFAAFGAGTIIIGQISKTEQAAHQIAINLISVTYVTIMGISTAGMIRVGQALAYQSRVRVWMAGTSSLVLAMVFMLVPTAAFLSIPGLIARLYSEETAVTTLAISLLFYAGLFQLTDAAQATGVSLLRSLNDVMIPSMISLLAFWVIGIPIGYWLAVYQGWNAQGMWMGYLIAIAIQAILFLRRFYGLVSRMV
jgi:multidrug resistance protein, MATE family